MSSERKQVIADLKEEIHLAEWVDDPYAESVKVSLLKDALALIENEQKPRWIPVTERLPKDLQTVLVVGKDGGIYCWMYDADSPTDEVWVDEYANAFSVYDTIYWQPLPEPPKEALNDKD